MAVICEEFINLITSRNYRSSRGWYNICCPSCGDKRFRGGFKTTPTGGFRYFCFNGGCDYNTRCTGWEPGGGLVGRLRNLFDLLGGDIRRIPLRERQIRKQLLFDKKNNVIGSEELKVSYNFSEMQLPKDSDLLIDAADNNSRAEKVLEYVLNRGFSIEEYPFMWSPEYSDYVLVPYLHYQEKIVGYMGRNIKKKSGEGRFIQKAPRHYVFNQHKIPQSTHKYVIVLESPMDAIMLDAVSSRGSHMTSMMINLLKSSGKTPVLVPDLKGNEWLSYVNVAKDNKWLISFPPKGRNIKDVGEAIQQYGRIYTASYIMDNVTKNYGHAIGVLKGRG